MQTLLPKCLFLIVDSGKVVTKDGGMQDTPMSVTTVVFKGIKLVTLESC